MVIVHTDFEKAFITGQTFFSELENLVTEKVEIGQLVLPSGRVLVHDPGSLAFITEDSAFIRTVKPGRYPIAVAVARPENEPEYCGRVAAAGGGVHDHEYKFKLSEAIDDMTVVRMKFISGFRPMRTDMVVA